MFLVQMAVHFFQKFLLLRCVEPYPFSGDLVRLSSPERFDPFGYRPHGAHDVVQMHGMHVVVR